MGLFAEYLAEAPFVDERKWRNFSRVYRINLGQEPVLDFNVAPCPADLIPAFGCYIRSLSPKDILKLQEVDEIISRIMPPSSVMLPDDLAGQVPGFQGSMIEMADMALPSVLMWTGQATESTLKNELGHPIGLWEQTINSTWATVLRDRTSAALGLCSCHPFQLALRHPSGRHLFPGALIAQLRFSGCKIVEHKETPKQLMDRRLDEMGLTLSGLSKLRPMIDPKTIRKIRDGHSVRSSSRTQVAKHLEVDPEELKWE